MYTLQLISNINYRAIYENINTICSS